MHKCRHTRLSHTLSPNDMRCCCSLLSTPCGVAELEELQIRISTKPNSAHASKRKLSRPVANSLIWLKEARSKLDKKRTVKAISISISVDPDPLARCVVPRLQTATDCAARKGHAVWQCQPVWRRQVCRRTSVPVCLWLSLYLCVSVRVCVCISVSVCVCVPASAWVFCLIVLVCLAGSFKPRCIRAGAVQNSLFACQQTNTLRAQSTVEFLFGFFFACWLFWLC